MTVFNYRHFHLLLGSSAALSLYSFVGVFNYHAFICHGTRLHKNLTVALKHFMISNKIGGFVKHFGSIAFPPKRIYYLADFSWFKFLFWQRGNVTTHRHAQNGQPFGCRVHLRAAEFRPMTRKKIIRTKSILKRPRTRPWLIAFLY